MDRIGFNVVRAVRRSLSSRAIRPSSRQQIVPSIRPQNILLPTSTGSRRLISTTSSRQKGLQPEHENPPPKETEETHVTATAAEITESEYHDLADEYLETVLTKFEEIQDQREDVDVEFAAGVLTVSFPDAGTYVINKQPPNKQIWLSSPKSGPKRYDWAILGDGQAQKEGTGAGNWIYLRDKSSLNDLFLKEIGIDLSMPISKYGD